MKGKQPTNLPMGLGEGQYDIFLVFAILRRYTERGFQLFSLRLWRGSIPFPFVMVYMIGDKNERYSTKSF